MKVTMLVAALLVAVCFAAVDTLTAQAAIPILPCGEDMEDCPSLEETYSEAIQDNIEPSDPEPITPDPIVEQCLPGWGFGDTGHCHSGPPGLQNGDVYMQQQGNGPANKNR